MNKKGFAQMTAILIVGGIILVLFLLNVISFSVIINKISASPWLIFIVFILIWVILKDRK